jgi:hypothetical protein
MQVGVSNANPNMWIHAMLGFGRNRLTPTYIGYNYFFLRRFAAMRMRSAFSLMKPSASFWS